MQDDSDDINEQICNNSDLIGLAIPQVIGDMS